MKQENEFVLPNEWCVKVTKESVNLLDEFKKNKGYKDNASQWQYVAFNGDGLGDKYIKEITFDQFKEHVLKEIPTPENETPYSVARDIAKELEGESKKIIGYKLIKPEYKEAVSKIINDESYTEFNLNGKEEWIIKPNTFFTSACERLNKSGVLDIWFEPVYELTTSEKLINFLNEQGFKISEKDVETIIKIVNDKS